MKRVTLIIIYIAIWGISLASIFFILSVLILGDKNCAMELQNNNTKSVSIKSYLISGNTFEVNSVNLNPKEKFTIGNSINSYDFDSLNIKYDALIIYSDNDTVELKNRTQIVNYLKTLKRINCSSFMIK